MSSDPYIYYIDTEGKVLQGFGRVFVDGEKLVCGERVGFVGVCVLSLGSGDAVFGGRGVVRREASTDK